MSMLYVHFLWFLWLWYNKNSFISKRHHFGIFGLWIWFLELISNILFSLDHVKIINLPLCQWYLLLSIYLITLFDLFIVLSLKKTTANSLTLIFIFTSDIPSYNLCSPHLFVFLSILLYNTDWRPAKHPHYLFGL